MPRCPIHDEPLRQRMNEEGNRIVFYCVSCEAEQRFREAQPEYEHRWKVYEESTNTVALFALITKTLPRLPLYCVAWLIPGIWISLIINIILYGNSDNAFIWWIGPVIVGFGVWAREISKEWKERKTKTHEPLSLKSIKQSLLRDADRLEEMVNDFLKRKEKQFAFVASGIKDIDGFSGVEFERFMANFFRRQGYHVKQTKASGDVGVDLIISRENEMIAIQCKRYAPNMTVGSDAIQQVYTGKDYYGCSCAMVITTASNFSEQAKEMARRLGVILWNREILADQLRKWQPKIDWESYKESLYEKTTVATSGSNPSLHSIGRYQRPGRSSVGWQSDERRGA